MSFIPSHNEDQATPAEQNGESVEHSGEAEAAPDLSADVTNTEDDVAFAGIVEEKKPRLSGTTMFFMSLVAAGGLGVWLMTHRISAAAAAPVSKETTQAKETITTFLGGGSASIKSMESMLRNTEKVVQQFLKYPSMTQVPLSDLRTNPFRMLAPTAPVASDAIERKKREEERVRMLKAVQSLQLQSIMYSETRKACLIDNVMYREGQQVDAFTVEKITASSVVVRGGVYRFELKMQK